MHSGFSGAGTAGLKRLQVPGQCLPIVLLAHLGVGENQGGVSAVEGLHAVVARVHQGCLSLILPTQPQGEAQVSQDGIGLVQGEVSILELGELPVRLGGLEWALQLVLLGHHLLLPALALASPQHVCGLGRPWNREVDSGVGRQGGGRAQASVEDLSQRLTWRKGTTVVCKGISINSVRQ